MRTVNSIEHCTERLIMIYILKKLTYGSPHGRRVLLIRFNHFLGQDSRDFQVLVLFCVLQVDTNKICVYSAEEQGSAHLCYCELI